MNNLATKYWHRIRKLEAKLSKALKRIEYLKKENRKLREENFELRLENAKLKELIFGRPKAKKHSKNDLPKLFI